MGNGDKKAPVDVPRILGLSVRDAFNWIILGFIVWSLKNMWSSGLAVVEQQRLSNVNMVAAVVTMQETNELMTTHTTQQQQLAREYDAWIKASDASHKEMIRLMGVISERMDL